MLSLLHIENIALIDRADISFGHGFNVLTGETGAGKSIIIDAIGAVLGGAHQPGPHPHGGKVRPGDRPVPGPSRPALVS